MKRILLLSIIISFGFGMIYAEDYYTPLVREGRKWVYVWHYETGVVSHNSSQNKRDSYSYYTFEFRGDKEINGEMWKQLFIDFSDIENDVWEQTPLAYMREVDRVVYLRANPDNADELLLNEYPSVGLTISIQNYNSGEEESVAYDFNRENEMPYEGINEWSTVTIDGELCTMVEHSTDDINCKIIDGIGYDMVMGDMINQLTGGVWATASFTILGLSHVLNAKGDIIYKGNRYDEFAYLFSGIKNLHQDDEATSDAPYINLMRQPMSRPDAPGIYIHNGKKVVVK